MYRILGGIYLSSLDPLTNGEDLKEKYGISHILSILPGSIPSQYTTNYIHKQIEITDEETTNILEHFPETNEFIESALQNSNGTTHANKILVHCAHGVSRSPTVIIAYLIHKYNLTFDQAFHALKRKNEAVSPNDSFLEQLEIFNKMHTLKLDQTSKLYKQFLISITLKQDPSGSSLKDLNIFTNMESRKIATKDVSKSYRCKRCRTTLATNHDVEDHEQPTEDSEQSKFIRRGATNRIISVQQASSICSHHFIMEPLDWMKDELEKTEIEGRFNCPNDKCGAKIGGYDWRGSRCSCGKWVIPGIHLQIARVDEVKSK